MSGRRTGTRSVVRRLRTGILPVPGQAAGLAALVAVLAAALVSVPLMTGSTEEGAWDRERARYTESAIGATLHSTTLPEAEEPSPGRIGRAADFDDRVAEAAAAAGLPAPVFALTGRPAQLSKAETTPRPSTVSRISIHPSPPRSFFSEVETT